jgi:hypothetical protein
MGVRSRCGPDTGVSWVVRVVIPGRDAEDSAAYLEYYET